jgi:hypothetical protein
MQKDNPPDQKDDLRKEYESDPDTYKEKYDVPDNPSTPPPPSGDPKKH